MHCAAPARHAASPEHRCVGVNRTTGYNHLVFIVIEGETGMKRVVKALCTVGFCVAASASYSAPAADTRAPVRVIEPGELTVLSYTVMERLWTGTWRSAFWTTTYDTSDAAIAMLTRKAEKLGADAVTDLSCFRDAGTWFSPEGYFCSGLAIKLK